MDELLLGLLESAEQGDTDAQNKLGDLYYYAGE